MRRIELDSHWRMVTERGQRTRPSEDQFVRARPVEPLLIQGPSIPQGRTSACGPRRSPPSSHSGPADRPGSRQSDGRPNSGEIGTRWPAGHDGNRMRFMELEVVSRDGPIREANQDSAAARRVRIGQCRSESIKPSTRGFSIRRRARLGASKPKTGKGFRRYGPNRPVRPSPSRTGNLSHPPIFGSEPLRTIRRANPDLPKNNK